MTKCVLFWKKVQEFKENDDFEGFREWCEYKSYEQARLDWNTIDTLFIIARKLERELCEVLSSYKLSENALFPIISERIYASKDETKPSPIQEKAIEILLPKIKSGERITQADSRKALDKARGFNTIQNEKKNCQLRIATTSFLEKVRSLTDDFGICKECNLEGEICKNLLSNLQDLEIGK